MADTAPEWGTGPAPAGKAADAAPAAPGAYGGAYNPDRDAPSPEELARFMAALRQVESGANYTVEGPSTRYGKATGAYQYLDSTWNNYRGFAHAKDAPPAVQDARAAEDMARLYGKYHDWSLVAVAWYGGEGAADRAKQGGVTSGGPGMPDTNKYAQEVMGQFNDFASQRSTAFPTDAANQAVAAAGGTPAAAAPASTGATPTPAQESVSPNPLPANATPEQIDAYLAANYPAMAGLLNVPEIHDLVTQWVHDQGSPAELLRRLYNTNYWQSHSESSRAWDNLQKVDPAEAAKQLGDAQQTITAKAQELGVPLSDAEARFIAAQSKSLNWQDADITRAIVQTVRAKQATSTVAAGSSAAQDAAIIAQGAPAVRQRVQDIFNHRGVDETVGLAPGETAQSRLDKITNQVMSGQRPLDDVRSSVDRLATHLGPGGIQDTSNQLSALARDYFVPMAPQDAEKWALNIADGSATHEGFRSYLVGQAKGRFANDADLQTALDQGQTVKDYTQPLANVIAQQLELPSVDLFSDPKYWQVIEQSDPKTGAKRPMTLSEAATWARSQDAFKGTQTANQLAADQVVGLGKRFGVLSG